VQIPRIAANWALALAIIALIATMQWLDGPDDIQTERAIAADLADAQAQAHEVQP
jgi:hypothetical protein